MPERTLTDFREVGGFGRFLSCRHFGRCGIPLSLTADEVAAYQYNNDSTENFHEPSINPSKMLLLSTVGKFEGPRRPTRSTKSLQHLSFSNTVKLTPQR